MHFSCLLMWHFNVKHWESYALRFISKAPPTEKYDTDLLRTGSGFGPLWGRDFPHPPDPSLGLPSLLRNGYSVCFPGIELPGRRVVYHPNIGPRLDMGTVIQRPLRPSGDMLRGDLYLCSSFRCSVCRASVCPDHWLYFAYVYLVVNHLI
jgi:hypothetical protein